MDNHKPTHTPEPWKVLSEEIYRYIATSDGDTPFIIARCFPMPRKDQGSKAANTARIVACVNAFEGIADPDEAIRKARDAMRFALGQLCASDCPSIPFVGAEIKGKLYSALAALGG